MKIADLNIPSFSVFQFKWEPLAAPGEDYFYKNFIPYTPQSLWLGSVSVEDLVPRGRNFHSRLWEDSNDMGFQVVNDLTGKTESFWVDAEYMGEDWYENLYENRNCSCIRYASTLNGACIEIYDLENFFSKNLQKA